MPMEGANSVAPKAWTIVLPSPAPGEELEGEAQGTEDVFTFITLL